MQKDISMVAAVTNKMALQLTTLEHEQNELTVSKSNSLTYCSEMSNLGNGCTDLKKTEQGSPSELAFQMTAIALHISQKLYFRAELAKKDLKIEEKLSSKEAEQLEPFENVFPWSHVHTLSKYSRNFKRELKKILFKFYLSYPTEVQIVRQNFSVCEKEWTIWLKKKEFEENKKSLKAAIIAKASFEPILIRDVLNLAKRINKSNKFRPTKNWCIKFIVQNNLSHFIQQIL